GSGRMKPPIPSTDPHRPQADDDVAGILPGDETDDDAEIAETAEPAAETTLDIEWGMLTADAAESKAGIEVIHELVKRLPNAPGVYRMMNMAGDVLYVGKARSLKKRVTNYAQGRGHTNRIGRMVRETATMEFVVTRTETEALLLEANLIKRLRPR